MEARFFLVSSSYLCARVCVCERVCAFVSECATDQSRFASLLAHVDVKRAKPFPARATHPHEPSPPRGGGAGGGHGRSVVPPRLPLRASEARPRGSGPQATASSSEWRGRWLGRTRRADRTGARRRRRAASPSEWRCAGRRPVPARKSALRPVVDLGGRQALGSFDTGERRRGFVDGWQMDDRAEPIAACPRSARVAGSKRDHQREQRVSAQEPQLCASSVYRRVRIRCWGVADIDAGYLDRLPDPVTKPARTRTHQRHERPRARRPVASHVLEGVNATSRPSRGWASRSRPERCDARVRGCRGVWVRVWFRF